MHCPVDVLAKNGGVYNSRMNAGTIRWVDSVSRIFAVLIWLVLIHNYLTSPGRGIKFDPFTTLLPMNREYLQVGQLLRGSGGGIVDGATMSHVFSSLIGSSHTSYAEVS